jgi:hypothetical protein
MGSFAFSKAEKLEVYALDLKAQAVIDGDFS